VALPSFLDGRAKPPQAERIEQLGVALLRPK
jgi:hypothetical protein